MKTYTINELETMLTKKQRRQLMNIGFDELDNPEGQHLHELDRDGMLELHDVITTQIEQLQRKMSRLTHYMMHCPADWDALRRSLS